MLILLTWIAGMKKLPLSYPGSVNNQNKKSDISIGGQKYNEQHFKSMKDAVQATFILWSILHIQAGLPNLVRDSFAERGIYPSLTQ